MRKCAFWQDRYHATAIETEMKKTFGSKALGRTTYFLAAIASEHHVIKSAWIM